MNVSDKYNNNVQFKSRCQEIKLGQKVCGIVNKEFPHYSLSKFNPMMQRHLRKVKSPTKVMWKIINFNNERPGRPENYLNHSDYIGDLFGFINKFHSFNCQESAILSVLILKLNGIKNAKNAFIKDGSAESNHAVCIFNRDDTVPVLREVNNRLQAENNKTIIVDPWTGICDFANNVLKEYQGFWHEHLREGLEGADRATGVYGFDRLSDVEFSDGFLEAVRKEYPNLIIKNVPQKKG